MKCVLMCLREDELENMSAVSKEAMSFDGMKMKITLEEDKVSQQVSALALLCAVEGVLCFTLLGLHSLTT